MVSVIFCTIHKATTMERMSSHKICLKDTSSNLVMPGWLYADYLLGLLVYVLVGRNGSIRTGRYRSLLVGLIFQAYLQTSVR